MRALLKTRKGRKMKNRFNRLVCMLLVLSMMLCMFTVFASATEGDDSGEEEAPTVVVALNRTFDEGWVFKNGLGSASPKNHKFELDYEEGDDFTYNYFARVTSGGTGDGFYGPGMGPYNIPEGYLFLEISVKTDDVAHLGGILYYRNPANKKNTLLTIKNNGLYAHNGTRFIADVANDEWIHIVARFKYSAESGVNNILDIYTVPDINDYDPNNMTKIGDSIDVGFDDGLERFRIGYESLASRVDGQSWCFDNIRIYTTDDPNGARVDIRNMGYGAMVNEDAAKTVDIQSSSTKKSLVQILNESLIMKVGVNYALNKGVRTPIYDGTYGAPVKLDGQVYLPLAPVLDYIQYSYNVHSDGISYDVSNGDNTTFLVVGREFASVNGESIPLHKAPAVYTDPKTGEEYTVIAKEDVERLFPGVYVTWDEMGLIVVSKWCETEKDENGNTVVTNTQVLSRKTDLDAMLLFMKKFIFDYPTGEEVYEDVKEHTNGFERPYLMADQDHFDYLHDAYIAKPGSENYDAHLKMQLDQLVENGYAEYNEYSKVGANGEYLGKQQAVTNPYDTPEHDYYGYDVGGRLNESGEYNNEILAMAMAFQITRDDNLLKACYDYMVDMGEWEHWGPGHFLNCADATTPYALSFDWLFNDFVRLGYDTFKLAEYIYLRGVYEGYCSVIGEPNLYGRTSNSGTYSVTGTNWNAVCTAGTTIGALAIMPYSVDNGYPQCAEWDEQRNVLVEKNLYNLGTYGLNAYIPDGSYAEGTGYWGYATNNVYRLCAALDSAAGSNYGYMDTWALDTTCYFACFTESNPKLGTYQVWNYNDGGSGGIDTSLFNYVSQYYGDPALAAIRADHVKNGKAAKISDVLFYVPFDPNVEVELPLDYSFEGINGAVSRASWETGALYVGLLGGNNNVNHGDIDSGTFIYEYNGIRWFTECGAEDYNVKGYSNYQSERFNYFRKNAEGQSVVFITSMQDTVPYGQALAAGGQLVSFKNNDYGAAAIIDNTEVYNGYAVSAKRGMLLTDNRETVIIQDEITLDSMQRVVWSAITTVNEIIISDDGRTAYLKHFANSKTQYLKVSLVSAQPNFRFSSLDCVDPDNYFLDCTYPIDSHKTNGGQPQKSRNTLKRLVVDAGFTVSFNMAIVIEYLGVSMDDDSGVPYSWVEMSRWEPVEALDGGEATGSSKVVKANITQYARHLEAYKANGTCFGDNIAGYYDMLVEIDRIMLAFSPNELTPDQRTAWESWLGHCDEYNAYKDFVKKQSESVVNLAQLISGLYS